MALPAVATTVIPNLIYFWNEFLYAVVFISRRRAGRCPSPSSSR
jgi:ABC-type glycerol-3-phosphate transport system permease component